MENPQNQNQKEKTLEEFNELNAPKKRKKEKKRVIISLTVLIAACVLVYIFNPENSSAPSCISLSVFGFYCPACGMTRAAYSLMHLNIKQAFYYNQFFVITLPFFAYIFVADCVNTYFGKKIIPLFKFKKEIAFIVIAVFLIYGILRNFDLFSFLAPQKL